MALYVVVIGPPGAGKGTQAKKLACALGLAHVSTGDLFRDNIRDGTDLGKRVEATLSGGGLVPDELTIALVNKRLQYSDCARGAVLDGFPRTLRQARSLDDMLEKSGDRVVLAPYISVRDEVIFERLTYRRVDLSTGKIYHLQHRPPPPGTEVTQRADDRQVTVRKRITEFYKNTAPLIAHYTEKEVLQEIDGEQPIEAVTKQLLAAVNIEAE